MTPDGHTIGTALLIDGLYHVCLDIAAHNAAHHALTGEIILTPEDATNHTAPNEGHNSSEANSDESSDEDVSSDNDELSSTPLK